MSKPDDSSAGPEDASGHRPPADLPHKTAREPAEPRRPAEIPFHPGIHGDPAKRRRKPKNGQLELF